MTVGVAERNRALVRGNPTARILRLVVFETVKQRHTNAVRITRYRVFDRLAMALDHTGNCEVAGSAFLDLWRRRHGPAPTCFEAGRVRS